MGGRCGVVWCGVVWWGSRGGGMFHRIHRGHCGEEKCAVFSVVRHVGMCLRVNQIPRDVVRARRVNEC